MQIKRSKKLALIVLSALVSLCLVPSYALANTLTATSLETGSVTADVSAQETVPVSVRYHVLMKKKGKWQGWRANNATAGKASNKSRIYRLAVKIPQSPYAGDICYRVRLTNGKWKAWKKNGASTVKSPNIEAVQIQLTGELAERFDVVYRVNVKGVGWQKRMRNGEIAGTKGKKRQLRAIKIQLVPKEKCDGWIGEGKTWQYFKNGTPVSNCWITTKESPINLLKGSSSRACRYWINASGHLAVKRIIDPSTELDSGAGMTAYATKYGYILVDSMEMIDGKWYIADSKGALTTMAASAEELIERYVTWAVNIANDSSHGYTQNLTGRWGPDYDCSSLVVSALSHAGLKVGNASWTGNMKSELTKYGFKWHTDLANIKRGDILLVHNSSRQHTEIYLGGGKTVGAHIAETGGIYGVTGDQTGNEISVGPYYSIWQGYLRLGS